MLELKEPPISSAACVWAELTTARRVMANLLSDAERSTVQNYIADLEHELLAMQQGARHAR